MRKKGSTVKREEARKRLAKAMAASELPESELAKLTGEDGAEEEVWVDNQQYLADSLGVDRRTVAGWCTEPGAPRRHRGKYNIPAWREWMIETGKRAATKGDTPIKYELEVRKLTAVCNRLELEHQIRLNQYHLNTDCELWVGKAMTAVRTLLLAIPSKMAPTIEMRSKEECEALLREAIDEALIAIHEREWPSAKAT